MSMRKSIIVAMDKKNGIGFQNRLPWHLPAELKQFKQLTMGHHLIMGRKTYESIGRPLPGRTTIVVTRNSDYQAKGCLIAHSLEEAFRLAKEQNEDEVFVCGGRTIYQEALESIDRLYLTRVHAEFQTDTSFPDFEVSSWVESSAVFHSSDHKNPYPFTFYIYDRR